MTWEEIVEGEFDDPEIPISHSRIRNVKFGDVIKAEVPAFQEGSSTIKKGTDGVKVEWLVVEVYPYIVRAMYNGIYRCFSLGELVQLGLEPSKPY